MTKTNTAAKPAADKQGDAKDTVTLDNATGKPVEAAASTDAKPAADTPAADKQGDAAAATEAAAPAAEVVDPFANLPTITVGEDDNVLDLTQVDKHADPRKYAKVHADAVEGKLPIQRGWKYADAVFVPGHNRGGENGFKTGSVNGTISELVRRAGKQGISAQELVTAVRKAQIGNKRSVYCNGLPPVGWVEGWMNSAVRTNIVGVHPTKKAKPLVVAAKGTEATAEQDSAAKKLAANG